MLNSPAGRSRGAVLLCNIYMRANAVRPYKASPAPGPAPMRRAITEKHSFFFGNFVILTEIIVIKFPNDIKN